MKCCCSNRSGGLLVVAIAAGASLVMQAMLVAGDDEGGQNPRPATPSAKDSPASLHGFTMNRVNGAPESLSRYEGEVILVVNVASKCGLTPQYEGLQSLYEAKRDEGFVVLAFPANNFMDQEPGTNEEIAEFCSSKYGVTFPIFEKISVKGGDIHPLYEYLTGLPEPLGGEIRWNFDKFLVNREGQVVARYSPRTTPSDAEMLRKIDELIAEPHP